MRSPTFSFQESSRGFSLIELLTVITIIAILSGIGTAVVSNLGAGNVEQASDNAEGVLANARQFAISHSTYVRVGFAQYTANGRNNVVVQCIGSTTGDLRNDPSGINVATDWPMISAPVVLKGASLDPQLLASVPNNAASIQPLTNNLTSFSRNGPGGSPTNYNQILQFNPNGQASVNVGSFSRCIGLGLSNAQQSHNAVVILLSGLTGNVQVLRQENLNLQ